jgi:hypothetical protein
MDLASIELLRAFSGALRKDLPVDTGLPLNVKLPLERLRLVELLAEAHARTVAAEPLRAAS